MGRSAGVLAADWTLEVLVLRLVGFVGWDPGGHVCGVGNNVGCHLWGFLSFWGPFCRLALGTLFSFFLFLLGFFGDSKQMNILLLQSPFGATPFVLHCSREHPHFVFIFVCLLILSLNIHLGLCPLYIAER